MFDRFRSVIAIVALLGASTVSAADIPCQGCNYSRMMSRALNQGNGEHRVYNYSSGTIYQFSVTCSGNVVQGGGQVKGALSDSSSEQLQGIGSCPFNRPLQVDEVPLDNAMAAAWPIIMDFVRAANWQNGTPDLRIDSREPRMDYRNDGSVFLVLRDYPARQGLFNDIFGSYSGLQKFIQALGAAARSAFSGVQNYILIKFTFKDGTSIKILCDGVTQQFEFVKNSATQVNGDPIVEDNASQYQGNYSMAGVDQQAYLNYLGSMGVSIVNGGLAGHLSCTWDGQKLTCKIPGRSN